jgi:hypothetical protein
MDKATLRRSVFEALKKTPQSHFHAIENDIRSRIPEFERSDVLLLHEVLWDLLLQGVLAPGKNSLNLHLPFVHVTEYGTRCLEEGAIVVHDPDGYVGRLKTHGASDDIEAIAREAVLCYLAGRHAAATVLLVRATVAVLAQLRDALAQAGRQQGRGTRSLTTAATPHDMLRVVRRTLFARALPGLSHAAGEAQLSAAGALLDADRNSPASPLPSPSGDQVLAYLLIFSEFCRFAYTVSGQLSRGTEGGP